ncbi:uncharacterized protein [Clytia hemisphaerica]|uniref:uncharacterized protein isoform X2 n=1 Tax=Clytia hemisphaerica TaxID=252671 RepID=UPI0034D4CDF9
MLLTQVFIFLHFYNQVLSQALSRSFRRQKATFYENAPLGQCLKHANNPPLASIHNQALQSLCAEKCLAHAQCLSVVYFADSDLCHLYDVDLRTLQAEDFYYKDSCVYMDTIFRDICNELNSCYPYRCFSHGFYRSDCMANLYFSNELINTDYPNTKLVKMYGHDDFALVYDSAAKNLRLIDIYGFVDQGIRKTDTPMDLVQIERRSNSFKDFVFLTSEGKIQNHVVFRQSANLYPNQPFLCVYISLLPTKHEYLCIKKEDNFLYKINAQTGTSEAMQGGQLTGAQQHKGKLYATRKGECPVYVREGNNWVTYAGTKNLCVNGKFHIASNGEVYAQLGNDSHVFQWTGKETKWIDVSHQACHSFDIENQFICVTPAGAILKHDDFVPQPDLHFPFKHQNGTRIPYGRGTDDNGKQYVDLTASLNDAEIGIDQFGKGYVLAATYERVVLGKFDESNFRHPLGRAFTVVFWLRMVLLEGVNFSPFHAVKMFAGVEQGVHVHIFQHVSTSHQFEIRFLVQKNPPGFTYIYQFYDKEPFRYWTHIAVVHDGHMENDEWRRDMNFVTARSCEELQRQQPYTISGYYWVFFDNEYRPVWCDMKTDGGGWTRISYLNGKAIKDKMYTIIKENLDQSTAEEGTNFWLSQKFIDQYYNIYPFQQIRFVCERIHNEFPRMDFATPLSRADDVINYFVKKDVNNLPITNDRIKSCDIEVLETDQSYLSNDDFDCSKFTDRYLGKPGDGSDRLYHVLFSYDVPNKGKYDPYNGICQTGAGSSTTTNDRKFQIYVR